MALRARLRRLLGFRDDPGGRTVSVSQLDPADLAELEAVGDRLVHEYPGAAPEVIAATVRRLMARGVPIRALRGSGLEPGLGELCFADGTVLTVSGGHPGGLGRVAVQALQGHVNLEGCQRCGQQVRLDVGWGRHSEPLRALAVVAA
jgi:hypothetical protein